MGAKAFLALAVVVAAVLGVAGLSAFFVARDDATVPRAPVAPGQPRAAGEAPRVAPGNVVLTYSDERMTRALELLAERTAGAPSPALVAAGQAILVQRRPDLPAPVVAVTASRRLAASGPDDPALRRFVEHWLGRPG